LCVFFDAGYILHYLLILKALCDLPSRAAVGMTPLCLAGARIFLLRDPPHGGKKNRDIIVQGNRNFYQKYPKGVIALAHLGNTT
jgi:hypothetical protein